jgi:hypothetical protein
MRFVSRPLQKRQCKADCRSYRVRRLQVRGPMTASEYVFAIAMTVVIVWLAAEVSGQALRR